MWEIDWYQNECSCSLLYFALHVLFVSHETFCFYQTVYIFICSAYKLQVCSLNFCSSVLLFMRDKTSLCGCGTLCNTSIHKKVQQLYSRTAWRLHGQRQSSHAIDDSTWLKICAKLLYCQQLTADITQTQTDQLLSAQRRPTSELDSNPRWDGRHTDGPTWHRQVCTALITREPS